MKAAVGPVVITLCLSLMFTPPLAAQAYQCPSGQARINGAAPDLAQHLCDVVDRVVDQLANCHIPLRTPVDIYVVDAFTQERPGCVGIFDCAEGRIEILAPDVMSREVDTRRRFARLPPMVLLDSVVAHEMTHALVFQSFGAESGSWEQNEYLAYAMQLAFLSAENRALFLEGYPTDQPPSLAGVNLMLMLLAPDAFAAEVWNHFSAAGNGCDFVGKLLSGERVIQSPDL